MRPFVDWYVFHIVGAPVTAPDASAKQLPFPVRIFDLNDGIETVEEQLREISQFQPVDIAWRLRTGDVVAIASAGGRAVGCSWITFSSRLASPTDLIWVLRHGESVTYGSFVLPEWRGKRIHKCLDTAITAYLHSRGLTYNYGSMSTLNPQTLSLLRQANKHIVTTVVFIHVKGLNWKFRHSTQEPLRWRFRLAAPAPAGTPVVIIK